jgi:hypothetical protein
MGRLDELIRVVGSAASPAKRVLGTAADDTRVYRPFDVVRRGDDGYPNWDLVSEGRIPPPEGTDVGLLYPYEAIGRIAYPEGLAEEAMRRLPNSPVQKPYSPSFVPTYFWPQDLVMRKHNGVRISTRPEEGDWRQVIQVAAGTGEPNADALRTLIHEARHATQLDSLNEMRALRSISTYDAPGVDGYVVTKAGRRYLARPDELFTHLASAGDEFVQQRGRLINNVRDANAMMEALEAGEVSGQLPPIARQFYAGAYKNSPTARAHINNVLTRYFAVPLAAGAASQMGDD